MQLKPQQLSHVLAVWPVARLASVGPRHQPHLVPIVFAEVDGLIFSPIDGKPKRNGTLQRIRNVARDASVSILLDRYDTDWRLLWWIRIDATATVVSGADLATPELERIEQALRTKYPQYRMVELFSGTPTLLCLAPHRHTAWSAQPLQWESL